LLTGSDIRKQSSGIEGEQQHNNNDNPAPSSPSQTAINPAVILATEMRVGKIPIYQIK
jgi:hypothetical protein